MEEEADIKAAPVTRLRKRLSSVERQEESNSPTPSTPTKKRARLAAKPQLDLIEENAAVESPIKRITRKSISREIEADKTLTPSRRSTRTRSNTSLAEKEDDENLTPSKRTPRVRSNTSLLADIAVPIIPNSPRAKRATRRASLLGSDNEGTLSPAKGRRSRMESPASVDLQATPVTPVVTPAKIRRGRANRNLEHDTSCPKVVIEKIAEEEIRKSLSNDNDSQSSSNNSSSQNFTPSPNTRQTRLILKKLQNQTSSEDNAKDNNTDSKNNSAVEYSHGLDENSKSKAVSKDQPDGMLDKTTIQTNNIHDLSVSSTNLISNLDEKPKIKKPVGINKSTSAISTKDQSNRLRTRSCTVVLGDPPIEDSFCSDNEKIKKKKERKLLSQFKQESNQNLGIGKNPEKLSSKKKKKKKQNDESIVADSTTETALLNKPGEELCVKPAEINEEDNQLSKPTDVASNAVKRLFDTNPATSVQSFEIIDDSDSGDTIKVANEIKPAEDQCVPVAVPETFIASVPNLFAIQSCDDEKPDERNIEPMDIDETMPGNISLTEYNRSRNSSLCVPQNVNIEQNSSRKSSISILSSLNGDHVDLNSGDKKKDRNSSISKDFDKSKIENVSSKANSKKSQRKSISNISQNMEQAEVENKSTLVLSELNVSAFFANNASKTVINGDNSPRKSSISKDFDKSVTENTKSPRKSSILKDFDICSTENISLKLDKNKSTRKSSMSKDKSVAENTSVITSETKSSIPKGVDKCVEAKSKNASLDDNIMTKLIMNKVPQKYPKKDTLMPCLTSTPVQHAAATKTEFNTSTSMTPVNTKKCLSKSKNSTVSQSSDSGDDSSKVRNYLFDDEAMDAGDDYQSGDSQDEEERIYEKVNEISERGETLTSDDNVSNDSDYEKDSFLVSSDHEDSELLSGSGDDLDMSDNELTMSKKSKQKFNDRKTKEKKSASREMFEARHQLSTQEDKKNYRSRIDSTLLCSEDDNKVPPKKNKRMRIESETSGVKSDLEKSVTQNPSTDNPEISYTKKKSNRLSESCNENALIENESTIYDDPKIDYREIGHKKKKSKRLSESCSESALNENEMTVVVDPETNLENNDPLVMNVKLEPKTPQKDFNVSTVHFTDREEVEQVEVNENVTMMKSDETSDPLQASSDESDDESISENEEATKNYESILENLNNEHELPVMSKAVKSSQIAENGTESNKTINIDESSSESIDLKLLFSDESNEGDKGKENNIKDTNTKTPEKNIPLKRCFGKTNLRETINEDQEEADSNSENLPFFIDTVGSYGNVNDNNSSTTNTIFKNITTSNTSVSDKQKKTTSFMEVEEDAVDSSMFNISSKKNKSKVIECASDGNEDNISQANKKKKSFTEDTADTSLSTSKIKQRKADSSYIKEDSINSNLNSTKKNKKEGKSDNSFSVKSKKNEKVDTIQDDDSDAPEEISSKNGEVLVEENNAGTVKTSTLKKSKKNKKVSDSSEMTSKKNESLVKVYKTEIPAENKIIEMSTVDGETTNKSSDTSFKKKSKKIELKKAIDKVCTEIIAMNEEQSTISSIPKKNESIIKVNKTEIPAKNKKNKKIETSTADGEMTNNSSDKSLKKKSIKLESKTLIDEVYTDTGTVLNEERSTISPINTNKSKKGSHKSKKTKISDNKEVELMESIKITESKFSKTKKRKRLPSTEVAEEQEPIPVNHTKKPKVTDAIDADVQPAAEKSGKHSKKKNKPKEREVEQTFEPQAVNTQTKKRKKRDDDYSGIKAKVMKQDSLDEIHVPRLPDAILNQLDDKRRQEVLESKKSQVVSTTDFNVETTSRRKNKPSDFMEETVFLNNYNAPLANKQKLKTSLPKVLPFIPVASTSDKGFTTNFQVKVLTGKMEFVAKAEKSANFKNDYLKERRSKKLRTYDLYKKHKNFNLAKY